MGQGDDGGECQRMPDFEYLVRFNATTNPLTSQKAPVTVGRGAGSTSQCVAMIILG